MVIVIDRLFTITFYDRTSRMQGRAHHARAMHTPQQAPYMYIPYRVHMRTDPHIETTTYYVHYRIASHARRLSHLGAYDKYTGGSAARRAAAWLQTMPRCASGHAALHPPSSVSRPSGLAAAARLVATAGRPCVGIPSGKEWDASLQCSTCCERAQSDSTGLRGVRQ